MKILHLALQAPYNEGWGYQENLMPKYHAKLGHEVTLMTTCKMNSTNSSIQMCDPDDYISSDGFRVIRLLPKKSHFEKAANLLCIYDIYNLVKEIKPDFVMIHSLHCFSSLQIKKYVKKINPECVVIADNHLDENNSVILQGNSIRNLIIRRLWKCLNRRMKKCYKKVYGVSAKRKEVAKSVFGISENILDTLPAGADDEKINFNQRAEIRKNIREKYGIKDSDFLLVTGGKIDEKKNIDAVMEAVTQINRDDVKLLVFGNCSETIESRIRELAKHPSIRYIGWIQSDDTYNYFLAADLVVFPGLHSVMWEQACASKVPCVFHRLDGFEHFDVGGNCVFVDDVSAHGLFQTVESLIFSDKYYEIQKEAASEKTDIFLYSCIAKKSLEAI